MSIAIIGAMCSAFVTKMADPVCEDCPQYYLSGNMYYPAGTFGETYDCDEVNQATTCSYYKPDPAGQPNYYAPCRFGTYIHVGININDNNQVKK